MVELHVTNFGTLIFTSEYHILFFSLKTGQLKILKCDVKRKYWECKTCIHGLCEIEIILMVYIFI